ncbi:MAG: type IV secretory system conjugative DNA transfer family protein [Oscillospiraceae bacterium]|nr:type IV secretory system conjugative DNA transfer family protein [Oscillospiraceae bacterium]
MSENKSLAITKAHNEKSAVLPNGKTISLDTRETRLNNNMLVIAGSGAGKTRSVVVPNILAASGSYIVSDTKGNLYSKWSDVMSRQGYNILHLNLIHPELSDHYNPLSCVRTPNEVQKFAHQLIYAGSERGGSYDPFWDRASELLLTAITGYLAERRQLGERSNFNDISVILSEIDVEKWECNESCEIDFRFNSFREKYRRITGDHSWAYKQFRKFCQVPKKTMSCIIITLQTILSDLDTLEIRTMLSRNDIDISSLGLIPTIVFVEISDTDRSKDTLANIFYSQAMNLLCSYADECCSDSRLPVPVRFILDDFGTNCRIDGFQNMISNIRSRDISAMIILQSTTQLVAGYSDSAHTIIDNCDTMIYMGGNDTETAQMVSVRCNKPLSKILSMPVGTNWIIRRGEQPEFSQTIDLSGYDISELGDHPAKGHRNQQQTKDDQKQESSKDNRS